MPHSIYWIYRKNHTNPWTEGYVGKTDGNVAKRVEEHKNDDLTVGEKMRTKKPNIKHYIRG